MIPTTQCAEEQRIEELRKKIQDRDYIQYAILRIAYVLSNELIDMKGEKKNGRKREPISWSQQ